MNLDNLKPAWQQFKILNSMRQTDHEEIVLMLERAEGMAASKTNRLVMYTFMFVVLTIFCQGG
jgi:hypothetical protein